MSSSWTSAALTRPISINITILGPVYFYYPPVVAAGMTYMYKVGIVLRGREQGSKVISRCWNKPNSGNYTSLLIRPLLTGRGQQHKYAKGGRASVMTASKTAANSYSSHAAGHPWYPWRQN